MTTALESLTPAQAKALPMLGDLYGTGAGDAVLTRIKRATLRPGTPRNRAQPWNAPPAWVASAAYVSGNRVTNGGNIYLCQTAGTAAASGGPTGTGFVPITDNGVTWFYQGPAYAADAAAPTYSVVTANPAVATRFYRSAAATIAVPSAIAQTVTNDGWYAAEGGTGYTSARGFGYFVGTGLASPTFETDALSICIPFSQPDLVVEIDGRLLVDGAIALAATGVNYLTINFPDRRPKRITLRFGTAQAYYVQGIGVASTESVWVPPKEPGQVKGMYIGDSYSLNFIGTDHIDKGIASCMFGELGITNWLLDGVSGSGFAAGTPYTDSTRLAKIQSWAPDMVVAMCSINDTGTQAAITTAFNSWLATVRSYVPSAWIVIVGVMGKNTAEASQEGYIRQAIVAAADPKILFIPASGDAGGPWTNGTGYVSATTGVGNGDRFVNTDNKHLTPAGYSFCGFRAGFAARNALQAM